MNEHFEPPSDAALGAAIAANDAENKLHEAPAKVYVGQGDSNGALIKQSLIWNTTQNIKSIHKQLRNGSRAEKDALVELINTMINFTATMVRAPGETQSEKDAESSAAN